MKIFNVMMSKVNGGLEQVFLNYSEALDSFGHDVYPIIHPKSQIKSYCNPKNLIEVHNFNQHDFIAVWRLKRLIQKLKPDYIITHSHRAAYLIQKTKTSVPTIAVCHVKGNYRFGTRAIIALTESMRADITASGIPEQSVFTVPNMLSSSQPIKSLSRTLKKPLIIGTCVRFTKQKGCDVFIKACHVLKEKNIAFHAYIAGDGPEKETYVQLIKTLGLEHKISLLGWVNDKSSFYDKLDVFCLPSREEAFGLVLLESMAHGLPMVVSDLPGPREVIADSGAAVFSKIADHVVMASAIESFMEEEFYIRSSQAALERAHYFSSQNVIPQLLDTLKKIPLV